MGFTFRFSQKVGFRVRGFSFGVSDFGAARRPALGLRSFEFFSALLCVLARKACLGFEDLWVWDGGSAATFLFCLE